MFILTGEKFDQASLSHLVCLPFFISVSQQITDCVCEEYDAEDFFSSSDSVSGNDSSSFQMMKLLVPHMESVLQVCMLLTILVLCCVFLPSKQRTLCVDTLVDV